MHIFWWRLTFKWRMSQDGPPKRQLQMGQCLHEFLVQSGQRSHRQGKRGQQGLMATGSEAIGLGDQQAGQPAGHVVHVGHGSGAHGHRGVTFWAEAHRHRHRLLKPVAWTTRQWTVHPESMRDAVTCLATLPTQTTCSRRPRQKGNAASYL